MPHRSSSGLATTARKLSETCLASLDFQVVVNQQNHGNGKRIDSERGEALLDVVFKNPKFVDAQVGNEASGPVLHGDGHDDFVYRESNSALAVLWRRGRRVLLRGGGGGGLRRGLCTESGKATRRVASCKTNGNVFRRLFIALKPNFELKLSARVDFGHASIAPLRGILQGGSTRAGLFPTGHLSQRKVYMGSMHKLFDAMYDRIGCGDFGPSGDAARSPPPRRRRSSRR